MVHEVEDYTNETAYVAMLHGCRSHFVFYALLLGQSLKKFDMNTPCVLLVGKGLEDYPPPATQFLQLLETVWLIKHIDLVDTEWLDRTGRKRHRYVFSKIYALALPFRKLLFLDLDILIRRNPKELFSLPAPAGMFHGSFATRSCLKHGSEILPESFSEGCINAGMLRLDTLSTEAARWGQVNSMLAEIVQQGKETASYLPEQYYLSTKLSGWRHIGVAWNWEVSQAYFPWNGKLKKVSMPADWWKLTVGSIYDNIHVFHFSGEYLEPWWYIHFLRSGISVPEMEKKVSEQFQIRDPCGRLAWVVSTWLETVLELGVHKACSVLFQELYECSENWENKYSCQHCKALKWGSEYSCEECDARDLTGQPANKRK